MKKYNKAKFLLFILLTFFCMPLLIDKVYAAGEPVYRLYEDKDNVTWQYAYIEGVGGSEDRVEISFFSNPNNQTKVTVPSISELKNKNSGDIPSTVNKLYLVNYVNHVLTGEDSNKKPSVTNGGINDISLVNVTNVNGVSPMLNKNVQTKITFSPSGSEVGDEIYYKGVFEDAKLELHNLEHLTSIGSRAFSNTTLVNTEIFLTNLVTIGDGAFWGSNITKVSYINTNRIEYNAFRDCSDLSTVKIGDDVDDIAGGAFRNDENLIDINFNNVTKVGNYAFSKCTSFNIDISDTKFTEIGDAAFSFTTSYNRKTTIPKGVTRLGWGTFYNSGITSVNLNNVTNVGPEAFSECKDLSEIDFGKTEIIQYQAFYSDSSLQTVEFSDTVVDIQTQAFMNCSISDLDLNKTKKIGYQAFNNNQLTELYLPKSILNLGTGDIFDNNPDLKKVTIAYDTMSTGMRYGGSSYGIVSIFKTTIGPNGYKNIEEIILEAPYEDDEEVINDPQYGVREIYNPTSVGNSEDDINPNYGNATIYKNIIRDSYFYDLPGLKKVTIGEGYEFIGANAFLPAERLYSEREQSYLDQKYLLKEVSLPSTLKGIGAKAFEGVLNNSELKINFPAGLKYIGYQAFLYDKGLTNDLDLEGLEYLGVNAFQYSKISDVYLHDNLTYFGDGSLQFCDNMKNLIVDVDLFSLPGNSYSTSKRNFFQHFGKQQKYELIKFTDKVVTEPYEDMNRYESASFMYNLNSDEVDLEETGWTFLSRQFFQEAKIGTLKLPKNLTSINDSVFYNTEVDNVVNLPSKITSIGANAFNSAKLKINQLPSDLVTIGTGAFYNSDFHSDPVVPEGVTLIGASAFAASDNVEIKRNSFTFKNNLSNDVMQGQTVRLKLYNTKVDNLYFGKNVTELPSNTNKSETEFYTMDIKTVVFEGLETLPQKAFLNCKELTTVDFSNDENLGEIKELAFYNAENLNNIKFSDKGNTIKLGYSSIRNTGLTSIGGSDSGFDLTSNNFITEGGFNFSENKKLKTVDIPNGFNNNVIDVFTFWDCSELSNVSIGNKIETIRSYAFCGDSKLEKIFLWGDTDIEQTLSTYDPIVGPASITINNQSKRKDLEFSFVVDDEVERTIKPEDFTSIMDTTDSIKTYNYEYTGNGTITFKYPETAVYITVVKDSLTGKYTINIIDINPANFTIPSNTDIYTYSIYKGNEWDKKYEYMRRNEELGTNSKVYHLDEVLYLTSNHPKVILNDDETDFDKSNLIVYALRRDGIIMQSDKWGEFTTHYARTNSDIKFEKYDPKSKIKEEIIYDYPFDATDADVSTENFKNMTFKIYTNDNFIQKKQIDLFYTNYFLEDSTVQTDILPKQTLLEIVQTGDNFIKFIMMFIVSIMGTVFGVKIYKKTRKKMV